MEQYLEDRTALETKYSDLCKPLYKEIGNIVAERLYDDIEIIHKEEGGEKEEEGPKRDGYGSDDDAGEGEEREWAASLEDASDEEKIYGAIASRGTTTNNAKAAKDDDYKEGRMVGILQF